MDDQPVPKKKTKVTKKKITMFDGTVVLTDSNKKSDIRRGKNTKHMIPAEKLSTETGKGFEEYEIEDDYDSLPYPPPSKHPAFRKFWAEIIDNISSRENFNSTHLGLLETLCRLRVELRNLDDFVLCHGHTFRVMTVLGEQRKTYPEVGERMKVISQISSYSRLLDLVPKKDKSRGKGMSEEEEEWE